MEQETLYYKEGQAAMAVGNVVVLISGIGVAILVLIFVGVLGGQTYELAEDDIDAITNTNVSWAVKNSIVGGFEGLETTGNYMPLIVLAVIVGLILTIVLGLTALGGGGRGSVL